MATNRRDPGEVNRSNQPGAQQHGSGAGRGRGGAWAGRGGAWAGRGAQAGRGGARAGRGQENSPPPQGGGAQHLHGYPAPYQTSTPAQESRVRAGPPATAGPWGGNASILGRPGTNPAAEGPAPYQTSTPAQESRVRAGPPATAGPWGGNSSILGRPGTNPAAEGPAPYQTSTPAQEFLVRAGPPATAGPWGGNASILGRPGANPAAEGPSRPSYPDLHRATQPPHPSNLPSSSQGRPSEQLETSAAPSTASFEQLSIQEKSASSSKSIRFPLRPGKGTAGARCMVKANHFSVELRNKNLHHYDVLITPETSSRGVNRALMKELIRLNKESCLGGRLPAYDGKKSLYTAGPLPFVLKEFLITLTDDDGKGGKRRKRTFNAVIKFTHRPNLHHLEMFLAGRQADAPQDALQALDIVLRELPTSRYTPVGRSFYSPDFGSKQSLGGGIESWGGFYQSLRPTLMGLSLNIDLSCAAFIEPLHVIDFVAEKLNRNVHTGPLTDAERIKIKKALRGLKVEVTHRGNMRRRYRITNLTSQPTRDLKFSNDESGIMKFVPQYFKEKHGLIIEHQSLPCLEVGNPKKPAYLPMEVCKIVPGQRYPRKLNDRQTAALLLATRQSPQDRERDILRMARQNEYHQDPYAKEFGINICNELASIEARVLPAPQLKYHASGTETYCHPRIGQWNMKDKRVVNGGSVNNWTCINFSSNITEFKVRDFCRELAYMCRDSGITFALEPVIPFLYARPFEVERALKAHYHDAMSRLRPLRGELDLIIAILPDANGSLYGDLKRICETDIGVVTQCCLSKHVSKKNKQYLANLALKVNMKVGGRNTVLADAESRRLPIVTDEETIIFGADVTHPNPGEDSSPSIAAVVASQDWPEITKYAGLVSAQAHRQEIIQDLFKVSEDPRRGIVAGGMIRELLKSFKSSNGAEPKRIIFYRDGVSEGQFSQVLFEEVDAIKKACASLRANYKPKITFIVVQKRQHTRLFALNHRDQRSVDRSGNVLPGTVVDSKICHPTEFDFYLCSHAGIQGTSRPAHYHVLWDENNFTADGLQTLTYNLCYTYARCTRSVSIVPPAYYAHLAAFRARFYMERELSDNDSRSGPAASRGGAHPTGSSRIPKANVQPLPALKDNLKKFMFFV